MRRLVVAVLLGALALAGCGNGSEDGPDAALVPAPLPSIELPAFDGGQPVDLATRRGPMVINLWASWCGPCREEMPILQEFSQEYAGRVAVLGIDYQDPQVAKARELVEETGVTYPLLTDLDGDLDRLDPFPHFRGLPFLALVDAEGRVVHQEFVALDDLAELEALVEKHLEA